MPRHVVVVDPKSDSPVHNSATDEAGFTVIELQQEEGEEEGIRRQGVQTEKGAPRRCDPYAMGQRGGDTEARRTDGKGGTASVRPLCHGATPAALTRRCIGEAAAAASAATLGTAQADAAIFKEEQEAERQQQQQLQQQRHESTDCPTV
ncbi:hypothetical protein DQ04_08191010 [Trypanosoma grayi]|uniref:hypothetical protein n=1 Tax=Trypanosoma grayi TaxID=71804 RepID=UPI0004F413A6|nr:hypothetical protein DQ04_08191010 [Trypanosoma grayi]KEG08026.1 hypothetical protein DQ04_08191010 [Trypanosoma grayi]